MNFLLVNSNVAVEKIFKIAARKASIELDVVGAITDIPLNRDFSCIFIDDSVLGSGDFRSFKKRLLASRFCLILSKDSVAIAGFDSYIRKPFLPTDIYNALKNEVKNSVFEAQKPSGVDFEEAGGAAQTTQDSQALSIDSVDLSEFSDSEDEFLSGVKDAPALDGGLEIGLQGAQNAAQDSLDLGVGAAETASEAGLGEAGGAETDVNDFGFVDDGNDFGGFDLDVGTGSAAGAANVGRVGANAATNAAGDEEINFTYGDEADFAVAPVSNAHAAAHADNIQGLDEEEISFALEDESGAHGGLDGGAFGDVGEEIPIEIPTESGEIAPAAEAHAPLHLKATPRPANDEIDFAAAFALQDELLAQDEKEKHKPSRVGGDIYKKKEPAATTAPQTPPQKPALRIQPAPAKKAPDQPVKIRMPQQKPAPQAAAAPQPAPKAAQTAAPVAPRAAAPQAPANAAIQAAAPKSAPQPRAEARAAQTPPRPQTPQSKAPKAQEIEEISLDVGADSTLDSGLEGVADIGLMDGANLDSPEIPEAIVEAAAPRAAHADSHPAAESSHAELPHKDINDFSDEELDSLDDEMLLQLQEEALQGGSQPHDSAPHDPATEEFAHESVGLDIVLDDDTAADSTAEIADDLALGLEDDAALEAEGLEAVESHAPQVLDKAELDEVAQMLDEASAPVVHPAAYGGLGGATNAGESLAESLGESELELAPTLAPPRPARVAHSPTQSTAVSPAHQASSPSSAPAGGINSGGINVDMTEIIKAMPIDKLRELLSGVQITINITFPSKKQ